MTDASSVSAFPARPGGLQEWEDLLVRFEIMARVLRVTLEDAEREPAVAMRVLRRIIRDEADLSTWLHHARAPGEPPSPAPPGGEAAETEDSRALVDRFISLRSRNFAMLQRRGVEVWEWAAPVRGAGVVTAYQMVTARVRGDAAALRELREGLRLGAAAC